MILYLENRLLSTHPQPSSPAEAQNQGGSLNRSQQTSSNFLNNLHFPPAIGWFQSAFCFHLCPRMPPIIAKATPLGSDHIASCLHNSFVLSISLKNQMGNTNDSWEPNKKNGATAFVPKGTSLIWRVYQSNPFWLAITNFFPKEEKLLLRKMLTTI